MARPSSIGTRDVTARAFRATPEPRHGSHRARGGGSSSEHTRDTSPSRVRCLGVCASCCEAVDETTRALRDARAVAVTASQRVERQAVVAQLEGRLAELWDEVRAAWARSGRRHVQPSDQTAGRAGRDATSQPRALVDAVLALDARRRGRTASCTRTMGPPANSEGERVRVRREELCDHRVSGLTFLSKVPALGPGVGNRLAALIVDQLDRAGFGDHINRVPPIVLVGWNVDVPRSSLEESEDHDRHRVIGWSSAWEDISPLRDVRGHWGRWDLAPTVARTTHRSAFRSSATLSRSGLLCQPRSRRRGAHDRGTTLGRTQQNFGPGTGLDEIRARGTTGRCRGRYSCPSLGGRRPVLDGGFYTAGGAVCRDSELRSTPSHAKFYDGVWPGEEVL